MSFHPQPWPCTWHQGAAAAAGGTLLPDCTSHCSFYLDLPGLHLLRLTAVDEMSNVFGGFVSLHRQDWSRLGVFSAVSLGGPVSVRISVRTEWQSCIYSFVRTRLNIRLLCFGWNPIKSVVTVVISSCCSKTCDWQIGIFLFKENKISYYLVNSVFSRKKFFENGVPGEIYNKKRH